MGDDSDSESDDSEAYEWWQWWHFLPMVALGVQAVLHTPVPGELFENVGRAFGAGIVVPVAAGAYRWVVAKLGGFFYIRSRVWLVASVLALPAVIFDIYGWVAVLLALPVWFLDQLRTYGSSSGENQGEEANVSG